MVCLLCLCCKGAQATTNEELGDLYFPYLNKERMQFLKEKRRHQETVDATYGALSDRQCGTSDQELYAKALLDCFR
jgi:hypothetical protein